MFSSCASVHAPSCAHKGAQVYGHHAAATMAGALSARMRTAGSQEAIAKHYGNVAHRLMDTTRWPQWLRQSARRCGKRAARRPSCSRSGCSRLISRPVAAAHPRQTSRATCATAQISPFAQAHQAACLHAA